MTTTQTATTFAGRSVLVTGAAAGSCVAIEARTAGGETIRMDAALTTLAGS